MARQRGPSLHVEDRAKIITETTVSQYDLACTFTATMSNGGRWQPMVFVGIRSDPITENPNP